MNGASIDVGREGVAPGRWVVRRHASRAVDSFSTTRRRFLVGIFTTRAAFLVRSSRGISHLLDTLPLWHAAEAIGRTGMSEHRRPARPASELLQERRRNERIVKWTSAVVVFIAAAAIGLLALKGLVG